MKKISYVFVLVISMFITCSCYQKPDGLPEEEIPPENTDELTNRGCTKIWTTYEAENGTTDGVVLGKNYTQGTYESESSGRSCVMLRSENQQLTVTTSSIESNTILLRYSIPDGFSGTLSLYINGMHFMDLILESKYSYQVDSQRATNQNCGFFDEVRYLLSKPINAGSTIT